MHREQPSPTRPPPAARWLRGWSCVSTLVLVLLCEPVEAATRHVVLLQSFERGSLVLDNFTAMLRAQLDERLGDPVTFTEVVVTPAGFDEVPEQAMVEFLRSAFAGRPKPDLVMTTGGPAASFARKYRHELFVDSPLVYAAVDHRFVQGGTFSDRETAIAVANDPPGIIADILQLLPGTKNIYVVHGSGQLGRFWRQQFEGASAGFRDRVRFIWADGMTYAAMLERAATLPSNSVIFVNSFDVDAEGGTYAMQQVIGDLRARAHAPLFGAQSAELGLGVVGGKLMSIDEVTRRTTEVVLTILQGTAPAQIETPILHPGPYVFDWRELQRWGISENRLPAGSLVRFRELNAWDRYRWEIAGGVSALIAQMVLISSLLVSRRRRRRAEESLRESEGRFRVLANAAPVMIRMSGPDALATDFNVPWLNFTGCDEAAERGSGWMHGIHPDDGRCLETYRHALENGEPYRIEYRLRRADGEYRWLLETGQPRFTPDGSFAGYIGSAIDITELKAARATQSSLNRRLIAAQEQERSRIARELHDDVCQQLTMLVLNLDRLKETIPEGKSDARRQVTRLSKEVRQLAQHVSGISHRLHSSKLELFGLAATAEMFCKEVAARHGVPVEFAHANVPAALPEGVAINLFRVLQEALSNALKHSGASLYHVSLRGTGDRLVMEVSDDGCGFDTSRQPTTSGLGLVAMQERLRLVNGEATIMSSRGSGTRVVAVVPLSPHLSSSKNNAGDLIAT